jgi:hypothetical protein
MSLVIKQPLYNRFSLGRQCPIPSLSYHGPPSFNYRPVISTSKHVTSGSPVVKQKMYIIFSKPPHPVIDK